MREESTAAFDPALFTFTVDPSTCSAANDVLIRDSEVQATTGLGCQITSVRWRSYYGATPRTSTEASQLGVVQTVPALEAWRCRRTSGGSIWVTGPQPSPRVVETLATPCGSSH